MKIDLGHGFTVTWEHGSHYANYFDDNGFNYDCVTFAWEKDRASFMDAWNAIIDNEWGGE